MAKTVSVVGSKNREYFEANSTINNELEVNVYDLKDGEKRDKPYYSRKFSANETKEIRLTHASLHWRNLRSFLISRHF